MREGPRKALGLVLRPGVEAAAQQALAVIDWCRASSLPLAVERESLLTLRRDGGAVFSDISELSARELMSKCDPIVSLGGDGTLIGVAHYVNGASPVVLGVNYGTLGFLTEVAPAELFTVLQGVLAGTAAIEERSILRADVFKGQQQIFSAQAVNDVVIQKGARARLLDLDIYADSDAVMRLRADGLIIATPTGSTAYSLAAGGTIVHPGLQAMLITPICPHSLTSRPLLLEMDTKLRVTVPPYDGKVFLIVDGQVSEELSSECEVRLTRSPSTIKVVRSPSRSYFEILRTKLNWGIPNRGD